MITATVPTGHSRKKNISLKSTGEHYNLRVVTATVRGHPREGLSLVYMSVPLDNPSMFQMD